MSKKSRARFSTIEKQNLKHRILHRRFFPRALSKLHMIVRNSDWFSALIAPFVIGQSN